MLIIKGLQRSWCVTSKTVCSYSPLRLYCIKGPLLRLRCCLVKDLQTLQISSSSHSCYTSLTLHENIIALTHGWHLSDVKRVKTYWTGKSHQHHSSCKPPLPHSPAALHLLFLLSLAFYFFTRPILRLLSPSLCEMVDESVGRFAPLYHGSCYAVWL